MNKDQKLVALGMALAVAVTVIVLTGAHYLHYAGISAPVASALIVLSLAYGIAAIARKRFFDTSVINGAASDTPNNAVAIDKALLQNTLEQVVLAVPAYFGLAAVAPDIASFLLGPLVLLFLVGRICFFAGYHKGAGSRAFGFGLTFYPTLVALALFLFFLVT